MPHNLPLRPWLLGMLVLFASFGAPQSLAQNAADSPQANELQNAAAQKNATSGRPSMPVQSGPKTDDANSIAMGSSPLLLGPGDELEITVYGAPDLSGHTRISDTGKSRCRSLAMFAWLASAPARQKLPSRRSCGKTKSSTIRRSRSTPRTSPAAGSRWRRGRKAGFLLRLRPTSVVRRLQLAGGYGKASNTVTIGHREQAESTTLSISKNPAEMGANNVELNPVIRSRSQAGIVYVLGEVTRPGGYVLNASGGSRSCKSSLPLEGPLTSRRMGKRPSSIVLHRISGTEGRLKKLLHGKQPDIPLKTEDIVLHTHQRIQERSECQYIGWRRGTRPSTTCLSN